MAIDAGPLSGPAAIQVAAPRLPYAAAVVLVAFGVGTLLTLCDRFSHVAFGGLSYTHPTWTGQAW